MKSSAAPVLSIAIDVGGTFTDGVAELAPAGSIWVAKHLTTPDNPGDAIETVVQDLLEQVGSAGAPAKRDAVAVRKLIHGTTLVTNTLIERSGAVTALVATRGTRDALDIRRELRYDLYDLALELPEQLVPIERRFEIDERVCADGSILLPLSDEALDRLVQEIAAESVDSVAVCLLHAYANPLHERSVKRAIARRLPGVAVSLSSDITREFREYERMSTTVANAYVQPLMNRYIGKLQDRLRELHVAAPLRVMVSSGGFTSAAAAADTPISLLESGPAGGVLSAINTARDCGIDDILAFDMGGTTAKACVSTAGELTLCHTFEVARVHRFKKGSGLPMLVSSIELVEIGAGGGSIARVSALGLLSVGPESAGSVPGPACYGHGGTNPTVTDADLVLGYLDETSFLGGNMRLDRAAAEEALARLGAELDLAPIDVGWGICEIVNENMAAAARVHIAEKGLDPRKLTMVATGGAGPVHAAHVAHKLGINRIVTTIAAGAGSCLGFLSAPATANRSWSSPAVLAEVNWPKTKLTLEGLYAEAVSEAHSATTGDEKLDWVLAVEMRYLGQGQNLTVSLPYADVNESLVARLQLRFEERYRDVFRQLVPDGVIEVVTWRLSGTTRASVRRFCWPTEPPATQAPAARCTRRIYLPRTKAYKEVPVYDRYGLGAGAILVGPLVLEERESTLVVPYRARVQVLENLAVSVELA